ncbi:MAG TPA: FAD binding domain-containing protein [Spirochaetia bacterium]|nr:FAD binding domain-containing protein [Spirochaetia bacterium]
MIKEILRPRNVPEAVRMKSGPGAAYLGGGTRLNTLQSKEITTLISLEQLGLGRIETAHGRCVIGATASLQEIVDAPVVPQAVRAAASLTSSRPMRNMRTIGGELGHCAPDSTLIPVLIALDAEVTMAGKRKPYPIEKFCSERPADLILSVSVPLLPCAVRTVSRTSHSPTSLVVAVSFKECRPVLMDVRVVASDCRGQCVRLQAVELALEGNVLSSKSLVEKWVGAAFAPTADIHASFAYKRYLAGVLAADALHAIASGRDAP